MGGMTALGGPGVWAGGPGGMANLGQFGALGYPARPGPEAQEILQSFGQQVPEHLQQTQLFGGLEGKHPLLAKMLEGGIMGAAMTPNSEPGRAEGAGGGISRALQGVLGARQSERQFQIAQIVAPYQLARQNAELIGAKQEMAARAGQIQEMASRAHYFDSMANLTAPEARVKAAEMGMQFNEDKLKGLQNKWQTDADNYADRTAAMAKWHEYQSNMLETVAKIRGQYTLGSARVRAGAVQQFTKFAGAASKQYEDAVTNQKDLAQQLDKMSNSAEFLMEGDPNGPQHKAMESLHNQFLGAQDRVKAVGEINDKFKQGLEWGASALGDPGGNQTPPPSDKTNPLGLNLK